MVIGGAAAAAAVGQYGQFQLCGLFDDAVCLSLILCTVDGRVIGGLVIWKEGGRGIVEELRQTFTVGAEEDHDIHK